MATTPENAYPTSRLLQIQFGQDRKQTILDRAADLGVPASEAAAYLAQVDAAAAAEDAYRLSRLRTKDLGDTARASTALMNRTAASVIANVRAKAEISPDPSAVYGIASIAPRSPGTPSGPPLQPTEVRCALGTDGVNQITWTGLIANTSFSVERQLLMADGTTVPYTPIAGPTARPVFDATIPAGTATATYRVRAFRRGLTSPWSEPGVLQLVNNANAAPGLKIAA